MFSSPTALGGIGVAYNNPTLTVSDSTAGYGGVLAVNTGGFTAVSDMGNLFGSGTGSSVNWFLGSTTAGTLASATLTPTADNIYRLGGGGGTLTIANGVLTDSGGSSCSVVIGSASANGGGTVVLSGSNSYSGGTQINAATLRLGVNNALPTTGVVTLANAAAAALNLNNFAQTLGTLSGGGLSGGNVARAPARSRCKTPATRPTAASSAAAAVGSFSLAPA